MRKINVGIPIEENIYQQLKLAAARERRPVEELVQAAVTSYLRRQHKFGLARLLKRKPFKISQESFRTSLETDVFDR